MATDLGLAAPSLLNVAMNAVFACDDVVLRIARPNAPPASAYELADALTAAGVRVPQPAAGRPIVVENDGTAPPLVATAWERIRPCGAAVDWFAVGAMVRLVNGLALSHVPPAYPVPACTVYPWWRFDDLLAEVRDEIDDAARRGLTEAVERHRGWVEASGGQPAWVLCHGDVHPFNVLAGADGPVIIDWDLLCTGPPAWDHAPLLSMVRRWGEPPASYAAFARGYGRDLGGDPLAESLTVLRLVAATLMRVLAGRVDPAARVETARRLRYWRDEPDAPVWARS